VEELLSGHLEDVAETADPVLQTIAAMIGGVFDER
jgi:hypothetical protein